MEEKDCESPKRLLILSTVVVEKIVSMKTSSSINSMTNGLFLASEPKASFLRCFLARKQFLIKVKNPGIAHLAMERRNSFRFASSSTELMRSSPRKTEKEERTA